MFFALLASATTAAITAMVAQAKFVEITAQDFTGPRPSSLDGPSYKNKKIAWCSPLWQKGSSEEALEEWLTYYANLGLHTLVMFVENTEAIPSRGIRERWSDVLELYPLPNATRVEHVKNKPQSKDDPYLAQGTMILFCQQYTHKYAWTFFGDLDEYLSWSGPERTLLEWLGAHSKRGEPCLTFGKRFHSAYSINAKLDLGEREPEIKVLSNANTDGGSRTKNGDDRNNSEKQKNTPLENEQLASAVRDAKELASRSTIPLRTITRLYSALQPYCFPFPTVGKDTPPELCPTSAGRRKYVIRPSLLRNPAQSLMVHACGKDATAIDVRTARMNEWWGIMKDTYVSDANESLAAPVKSLNRGFPYFERAFSRRGMRPSLVLDDEFVAFVKERDLFLLSDKDTPHHKDPHKHPHHPSHRRLKLSKGTTTSPSQNERHGHHHDNADDAVNNGSRQDGGGKKKRQTAGGGNQNRYDRQGMIQLLSPDSSPLHNKKKLRMKNKTSIAWCSPLWQKGSSEAALEEWLTYYANLGLHTLVMFVEENIETAISPGLRQRWGSSFLQVLQLPDALADLNAQSNDPYKAQKAMIDICLGYTRHYSWAFFGDLDEYLSWSGPEKTLPEWLGAHSNGNVSDSEEHEHQCLTFGKRFHSQYPIDETELYVRHIQSKNHSIQSTVNGRIPLLSNASLFMTPTVETELLPHLQSSPSSAPAGDGRGTRSIHTLLPLRTMTRLWTPVQPYCWKQDPEFEDLDPETCPEFAGRRKYALRGGPERLGIQLQVHSCSVPIKRRKVVPVSEARMNEWWGILRPAYVNETRNNTESQSTNTTHMIPRDHEHGEEGQGHHNQKVNKVSVSITEVKRGLPWPDVAYGKQHHSYFVDDEYVKFVTERDLFRTSSVVRATTASATGGLDMDMGERMRGAPSARAQQQQHQQQGALGVHNQPLSSSLNTQRQEEISSQATGAFDRADESPKDGALSEAELQTYFNEHYDFIDGHPTSDQLDALLGNLSLPVSLSEWAQLQSKVKTWVAFAKADKNGDGRLSTEEAAAVPVTLPGDDDLTYEDLMEATEGGGFETLEELSNTDGDGDVSEMQQLIQPQPMVTPTGNETIIKIAWCSPLWQKGSSEAALEEWLTYYANLGLHTLVMFVENTEAIPSRGIRERWGSSFLQVLQLPDALADLNAQSNDPYKAQKAMIDICLGYTRHYSWAFFGDLDEYLSWSGPEKTLPEWLSTHSGRNGNGNVSDSEEHEHQCLTFGKRFHSQHPIDETKFYVNDTHNTLNERFSLLSNSSIRMTPARETELLSPSVARSRAAAALPRLRSVTRLWTPMQPYCYKPGQKAKDVDSAEADTCPHFFGRRNYAVRPRLNLKLKVHDCSSIPPQYRQVVPVSEARMNEWWGILKNTYVSGDVNDEAAPAPPLKSLNRGGFGFQHFRSRYAAVKRSAAAKTNAAPLHISKIGLGIPWVDMAHGRRPEFVVDDEYIKFVTERNLFAEGTRSNTDTVVDPTFSHINPHPDRDALSTNPNPNNPDLKVQKEEGIPQTQMHRRRRKTTRDSTAVEGDGSGPVSPSKLSLPSSYSDRTGGSSNENRGGSNEATSSCRRAQIWRSRTRWQASGVLVVLIMCFGCFGGRRRRLLSAFGTLLVLFSLQLFHILDFFLQCP